MLCLHLSFLFSLLKSGTVRVAVVCSGTKYSKYEVQQCPWRHSTEGGTIVPPVIDKVFLNTCSQKFL